MGKTVHIIPIGVNEERLLDSIRKSGYPIQKVYMVLGADKSLSGEKEIHAKADEIEKTLKVLIEVGRVYVDKLNVYSSALEMLKVIKKELVEGNEVLINASDAPRTLVISCYIAAQLSGSKLYIALPKYENGKEVGIDRILEVSIPPLKKISNDKVTIIKLIQENGGEVESINKLIDLLEGRTGDQKKYMAQRARMSYHLKGLEEDGLIVMKREGKNVKIILTELGKAYALMHS
jgi:DNA-binding transcriptional ArsR family regulator